MYKSIMVGAALIVLSTAAFANNGNGNGNGNNGNNGNGGAGGTGVGVGVGVGVGIANQTQGQSQGQVQGQSQSSRNTNVNANSNRNRNTNANVNSNGARSDARGGDQSQGQEVNNQGAGSNSNNYNAPAIPVSSATAPSFAIGSCQWAFSGGLQLFGAGVSAGSAGMYEFCKALMKSKHMVDRGNADVAKALECQDRSIRAANKSVGQPCLEDMPRQVAAATPPTAPLVPVVSSLPANCREQTVGASRFITCE